MTAVLERPETAETHNTHNDNPLAAFAHAIEQTDNLEITGTSADDNDLVIRNHSIDVGIEGAYIEVSIKEIIKTVGGWHGQTRLSVLCYHTPETMEAKAQEFVNVIQNNRPPVVLQGVTRIVGYYSRVNNWNKSKVGELRDRAAGNYGLTGKQHKYTTERMNAINAL